MDIYLRLKAGEEDFHDDDGMSLIDILDKYLSDYSYESIYEIVTNFLTREHFYSQSYKGIELRDFNMEITRNITNGRLSKETNVAVPVLLTRTNSILLLNYISYKKSNMGCNKIAYSDLYYLLLDINEREESTYTTIPKVSSIKLIDEAIQFDFVCSMVKCNGLQNISTLRLPNIDRNYKLIKNIISTQIGNQCNNEFSQKFGFDIDTFLRITYFSYLLLYMKYSQNDFSNIIDINSIFNSIIPQNSPEQKLKLSFQEVLSSLSSRKTNATINNIKLYDTEYLWNNNIEEISPGVYRITDIGLFVTAAFTNIFLTFEEPHLSIIQANNTSANNILRNKALGDSFEDLCNSILDKTPYKKDISKYYKTKKGQTQKEIADSVFRIGDSLFFIECKAGYLSVNKITNLSPTDLLELIKKKFGGKYIDETHYQSLPGNEKKGVLQIMHNFSILNKAFETNDFSIYENDCQINELKKIKNIYGIVLVQESYLSIPGLNALIHLYNKAKVKSFAKKNFHTPFFVHINDLYKIFNSAGEKQNKKLTFEKAIKQYSTCIHDNTKRKMYSFNDYLASDWNHPNEINTEEYDKMCKNMLNELYLSAGLSTPNI